jgi:class 3 adenylate cyclase/predicted ATPase
MSIVTDSGYGNGTVPAVDPSRRRPKGERRHLTVMFCDLVGSTSLGELLDPEDLTSIIRAYQERCATVIERFDGKIARYEGDGLLVYFSYPQAHEDDAERAIRAALDILHAFDKPDSELVPEHGVRLSLRIGIHSGPVVVGEAGSGLQREMMALGHTMNLAARLQGIAEPDTVIVSDQTLRLVRGLFITEDLGTRSLKGIRRPVRAHRILRPSGVSHRLDSAGPAGLVPLVGRENDLSLLLDRWARTCEGHGQVVLLSGEPGIGKSRLVRELRARLPSAHAWLECRASPYHQSSALYPVIGLLREILELGPDETLDDLRAKLGRELGQVGISSESVPLLMELLSLPLAGDRTPLGLSPELQRRRTLDTLVTWLTGRAARQSTVLVLEDLHWIDPSTLELLGMMIEQVPTTSLLLLPTFRPTFEPPWENRSYVTQLTLAPLTRPEVAVMAQAMAEGKALPPTVVDQLQEKTDGVPLFVEELTKSVLESGVLAERDDRYERRDPSLELAVPATLQDSLMARLDRLGAAKETAQLAAVLGREFTFELLEAVSTSERAALGEALGHLTGAELLYQRGIVPQATYAFKHALIQDTAYHSLLRSVRQRYHGRVAEILETRFPELAKTQLEVLARHHQEAGNVREAIGYRQLAGEEATRRSANLEAIGHLTRGIDLARTLERGQERDQWEALFRVALGVPLQAVKGYADAEVEDSYRRAHELCSGGSDAQLEFRALWGLFQVYNSRAELATAREIAAQLLDLARRAADRILIMLAHAVSGIAHFWGGQPDLALGDADEVLARYDATSDASLAYLYGQDPSVAAWAWGACCHAQLGRADLGRRWTEASLELARRRNPFDLAFALVLGAIFHVILGQRELARQCADEGMAVSSEHGFPLWFGASRLLRCWSLVGTPGVGRLTDDMRLGMVEQAKTGNQAGAPLAAGFLAEAYLDSGHPKGALGCIEGGLALSEHTGSHVWDAELLRLRAELFLRGDPPAPADAERDFRRAVETARRQGMRTFELRSTIRLAQLALERGERAEARAMLAPLYDAFTEGFDTPDLGEAKALLERLDQPNAGRTHESTENDVDLPPAG